MMPLTLHAFLRFADRPRPLRLLWAGYALALCFYAGEPQTMLLSGVIGAVWIVGAALLSVRRGRGLPARRRPHRGVGRLRALPRGAGDHARGRPPRKQRAQDRSRRTRAQPLRQQPGEAPGMLLPWAFDNTQELSQARTSRYTEYLAGEQDDAFVDCIVLGAPVLLLAFASGKRGRFLLSGAAVLVIASTGSTLHVLPVLEAVIPGMKLFRYPEKLIAPASMMLCLAAALAASRLDETAARLRRSGAACAVILLLALRRSASAPRRLSLLAAGARQHRRREPCAVVCRSLGSRAAVRGGRGRAGGGHRLALDAQAFDACRCRAGAAVRRCRRDADFGPALHRSAGSAARAAVARRRAEGRGRTERKPLAHPRRQRAVSGAARLRPAHEPHAGRGADAGAAVPCAGRHREHQRVQLTGRSRLRHRHAGRALGREPDPGRSVRRSQLSTI